MSDNGEKYVAFRAKTNDRLKKAERRLDDAEERLDGHDTEIAEIDADVLTLTNISLTLTEVCARAAKRKAAREKLRKISRRRSE